MPLWLAWVVVHGRMSVPWWEISNAARAFAAGSFRSPQRLVRTPARTLICHSPNEFSPWPACASVRPPDSAMAIAVQVTAWSGLKPAARAYA